MRLIDAEALKKEVNANYGGVLDAVIVNRFIDEYAPTVDAELVVRCKDCTYRSKAKANEKGFLICPASGMEITDNDFCSWAVKRRVRDDR